MQLSKNQAGLTPYQTNIPVYSAGQLYDGALMMLNASAWSGGAPSDGSAYNFVIAAADNGTAAIDTIGVLQASSLNAASIKDNLANNAQATKIGTDYFADALSTVGGNYLPAIITPDVLYMAEYYQQLDATQAGDGNVITAGISASVSTTVTITDLQDHLEKGFLFSTKETSSTAYEPGQLRYITVSAATGACTIDSAMKVSATTDFILGLPPLCTRTGLTDDGVGLCSLTDKTANDASVGLCTGLMIWDNYIRHEAAPEHAFRYWVDKGLDGLKAFRAFAEVVLTDHMFGRTVPA